MTPRIVHFYFFRFRLILREIRHFVFCIGLYTTDRSAISLRVAAKTRSKKGIESDPPPTVEREEKMIKWRLPMRYICNLFAKQIRTLLPWPICRSIDLMLIITPLKPNTRTLSRPIPTRHIRENGVKRNRPRRLQLLPFTRFHGHYAGYLADKR